MRKAGTVPSLAIFWSVLGWIWSNVAASSVFKTRSNVIACDSDSLESGTGCNTA